MKNKPILIIVILVAVAAGVSLAMNMTKKPSPEVLEPKPDVVEVGQTYNLMGIEMTEEEAIEHCQEMPEMEECVQFGFEGGGEPMSEEEMEKMDDMDKEVNGEVGNVPPPPPPPPPAS